MIVQKFEGKSVTEDTVDEAEVEVEEDNAFNTAAAKAAVAGETHFTFNGKKYPVKMSKADAEKLLDDVNEMDDRPIIWKQMQKKLQMQLNGVLLQVQLH